ncbi:MAG TPA: fibronectin type III domain-containing protein [Jatrophihabitans sp.]
MTAATSVTSPASAAPTPPASVTASAVTTSTASLSWQASQDSLGVEGYRVLLSRNGGATRQIATTDGAITKYNLKTLYAGSTYDVSVVALDTAGQTSPPGTTSFSTGVSSDTTAPLPPSDSSVSASAFSDTRVDVKWGQSPSTDVVGYRVLRDGSQVGVVDLPGGLRYSDNGLTANTKYQYTIEAVDSAGNVSSPTTAKGASSRTTLGVGVALIARGPYLSDVTGTAATVSWWTNLATSGVVHYGVGSLSSTANDSGGAVQHHKVLLTGLTPGTAYLYTVGNGTLISPPATFHTAAAPGTKFSFAAIGDFGGGSPGETQNAANIYKDSTSFIQTVGDNIYPSSGLPDPDFTHVYSDFDARMFKPFAAALSEQPLFPANGNQEYYSNGEFWATFPMPGTNHSWYSYDWGDAHILVLDSEQAIDPSSAQYAFAQSDLAAHQDARFRIVAIQGPPYSSSSTTSSARFVRQYLVPLFDQQHVALVLSGNSHNYERSVPLLGGNPDPHGTTYVVTGGGGNGHNTFKIPEPSWSAHRDDARYEFVKVSVSPTALRVDAIDAATNKVFDSTSISAATMPGTVVPLAAHRVLDTSRGIGAPRQVVKAHATLAVPVTGGSTGVPATAGAVLLSVRSAQVARSGAVSVYPHGGTVPPGGNVAAIPTRTSIGAVLVPIGADGRVGLTNATAGTVNLAADIVGYVRGGSSAGISGAVATITPHAVLNTSTGVGAARLAAPAHSTMRVTVRGGSTGIPADAVSALVTLRGWQVRKSGAVAVFPDGGRAHGQNLAAVPGAPTITQLLVPIGSTGKIALTNATGGTMQLAATVSGFVRGGTSSGVAGAVVPVAAHQVLGTASGVGAPHQKLAAHGTLHVVVTGAGVPATASAVVLNLTALNAARSGGVLAYAEGAARPADASLAAVAGSASFGQVVVPIGPGGKVVLTNSAAGAMDLAGYVTGYVRGG